jgi:hypothetical protein
MPIFMDRHEMRGLRAEDVAEAHRKDLEIQDQYGVKYLTYWYDSERCTGFCLVDAPDAATAEQVHREAHGEIASEIIPVDLATVEAFLGRISDPRQRIDSFEQHDALVRRGLAAHGGREVKHTGDGIMAVFDEVTNAVLAAADIQRRFSAYNAEATEDLRVRIGIDAGEPVAEHNDLFGATVHLAFRLCAEAEADGILVSGGVRDLCGQDAARFVGLGARRLKGFAEPVSVFRFEWRKETPPSNLNRVQILEPPLRRAG